jgi:hypothetical protein
MEYHGRDKAFCKSTMVVLSEVLMQGRQVYIQSMVFPERPKCFPFHDGRSPV